jgi:hypothetical protein
MRRFEPYPPSDQKQAETGIVADDPASLMQQVRSLDAEVAALQTLICFLLEKNERLRMRLRACENAPWLHRSVD